jgi:hypothetical protein
VLWINRLPRDEPVVASYKRAGFAVGTSPHPHGPFTFPVDEASAMPVMAHAGGYVMLTYARTRCTHARTYASCHYYYTLFMRTLYTTQSTVLKYTLCFNMLMYTLYNFIHMYTLCYTHAV